MRGELRPHDVTAASRRSPAHCIEWAKLIKWEAERPGVDFDADVEEHMKWVFDQASARAKEHNIQVPPLPPLFSYSNPKS